MSVDILPKQGDVVSVRTRQYLVEDVEPSHGEHTLVRLSRLEDDAQGVPLEVLWEAEVDAHLTRGDSWTRVADHGFDDPRKFSAYLHALRWNTVSLYGAESRSGRIGVLVNHSTETIPTPNTDSIGR